MFLLPSAPTFASSKCLFSLGSFAVLRTLLHFRKPFFFSLHGCGDFEFFFSFSQLLPRFPLLNVVAVFFGLTLL